METNKESLQTRFATIKCLIVLLVFVVSSCGKTEKKEEVTKKVLPSESFRFFNDIEPYFKLVEGEYTLYEKDNQVYVELTFELLKSYRSDVTQTWIQLIPKDSSDRVIETMYPEFRAQDDSDGMLTKNFLLSQPGERIILLYYGDPGYDDDYKEKSAKELIEKIKTFQVKLDTNG